jgi:hypothetical protein
MLNPFFSARARTGRTKEHLDTLQFQGHAFFESRPYATFVEPNPDGLTETYKLRLVGPLPTVFDLLALEAVEHTRSALDHAAYATAVLAGKREPKACYFPIADSAAQLETDVIGRGRCKDIPPDILALFRELEPYQGGNGNPIWILNRLCNIGKHRLIMGVNLQSAYASIDPSILPPGSHVLPNVWDAEKNEIAYFSAPKGSQPEHDFPIAFYIAFGPIEPIEGLMAIPILKYTAEIVARIIDAVEAEIRRIGLL